MSDEEYKSTLGLAKLKPEGMLVGFGREEPRPPTQAEIDEARDCKVRRVSLRYDPADNADAGAVKALSQVLDSMIILRDLDDGQVYDVLAAVANSHLPDRGW